MIFSAVFGRLEVAARDVQTASFLPKGLGGWVYWQAMKPFHALIFGRMIRKVVELARRLAP